MKWSDFHHQFQKMVLPKDQIKGVDFVCVISHEKDDNRYKIGITEQNLFSRLRAYQTPFVEFHVQYLIALPDKGARVLEKELHNSKHLESKRMKFGKKHPDAKTSYSEWFKTDLGIIKYAIQRAFRYSDQHMLYFAYDLTGNALTRWDALEMYVSKPKTTTREIKTRSGRVHKRVETESKSKYKKYIGMKVKPADEDDTSTGTVIDVPDTADGKGWVSWDDSTVPTPLPMEHIIEGIRFYKSKHKND